MEAINGLGKKFPSARIVVLPSGMQVLARCSQEEKRNNGFFQANVGVFPHVDLVPMASVFFPALIAYLRHSSDGEEFKAQLTSSLNYTNNWMSLEYRRFLIDNWTPPPEQNLNLSSSYPQVFSVEGSPGNWSSAFRHWEESSTVYSAAPRTRGNLGIVEYRTKKISKLQIWRAMAEIDGYVACRPSKRKALRELVELGRNFCGDRSRHTAIMVRDNPGSGKSYLADRLARQLRMRFLKFNVTQMHSREGLLRTFDKIVTAAADSRDEGMLVFVDEINAPLGAHPIYDAFLAPLEDGYYDRGGNTFRIPPCFWVFAGTHLGQQQGPHNDREDKWPDFQSRLAMPPIDLAFIEKEASHEEKFGREMEIIYVAAATIQRLFPDVNFITRKALDAIALLPETISPRAISLFVKQFQNIQYEIVTSKNLPPKWREEKDYNIAPNEFEKWDESGEGNRIALESSPRAFSALR